MMVVLAEQDVEKALHEVEVQMLAASTSEVTLVEQAARHIIEAGGKRLRPRLLLYAFLAAGGRGSLPCCRWARPSNSSHATLVHDDINDHSTLRRGRATINAKWAARSRCCPATSSSRAPTSMAAQATATTSCWRRPAPRWSRARCCRPSRPSRAR
jgi:hypothetical protein